jgi:carbon storage regulator
MLVLTRRVGESVVIGHDVVVTVLEVRGDVVKVGITAPRDIDVDRLEVAEGRRAHGAVPGESRDA